MADTENLVKVRESSHHVCGISRGMVHWLKGSLSWGEVAGCVSVSNKAPSGALTDLRDFNQSPYPTELSILVILRMSTPKER